MTNWQSRSVLITLATYNERENLQQLVGEILAVTPWANVLVIDDNSLDGTGQLACQLAEKEPRLRVIQRPGKFGLGTAHLLAIREAIEKGYELLVTMDADWSHHPKYLPALLQGMDQYDLMIGSRYVAGGRVENWPISRQWMSKCTNWLIRQILPMPVHDTSGGYRCYSTAMLRRTDLEEFLSKGYSFQQEILHRCLVAGAKVGETPIVFSDRRAGTSKAGLREIFGSVTTLLRLGLWTHRRRGRQESGKKKQLSPPTVSLSDCSKPGSWLRWKYNKRAS